MKKVVITGLGALTPVGNNVESFWKNLLAGKSGAGPITHFDPSNFKTTFACEVKDFDPLQFLSKQEARKMDAYTHYAIAAADECMKDCGYNTVQFESKRTGVIWASGIGGIQTLEDEAGTFFSNSEIPRFSPFFIIKMIGNIAAGHLSIRYGLRGVSYSTVSACTSSNHAIIDAYNFIRLGKADAILAGGSEAPITRMSVGGFNASKALSTRNDSPRTASRPFDISRDGFVIGEGAGAIMLEELEHAQKRGAKIYCELVGSGCSSDAYHLTAPHPQGEGAYNAMNEALNEAKLLPNEVDYISAHATSTSLGDVSEAIAISNLFGNVAQNLHISATKSMTGHLLGAAGAIESIACILSIRNGKIPPTINMEEIDPAVDDRLNFTPNLTVEKKVNVAINNTFGFGGHIGVSVFKKYS